MQTRVRKNCKKKWAKNKGFSMSISIPLSFWYLVINQTNKEWIFYNYFDMQSLYRIGGMGIF